MTMGEVMTIEHERAAQEEDDVYGLGRTTSSPPITSKYVFDASVENMYHALLACVERMKADGCPDHWNDEDCIEKSCPYREVWTQGERALDDANLCNFLKTGVCGKCRDCPGCDLNP